MTSAVSLAVDAINLDAPAANPFPALRPPVDERQVRLSALESERENLLAELQAKPVAELSSGIHDEKIRRLGAVRVELHALAAAITA